MAEQPKNKPEDKEKDGKGGDKKDEKAEKPTPAKAPEPNIDPNVLLPETKREMEILWRKELQLSEKESRTKFGSSIIGRWNQDSRQKVAQILGEKNRRDLMPALPLKPTETSKIEKIYDMVAETRVGMFPYIQEKNPGKALRKTVPFVDKNGKFIEKKSMKDLVEDPDSREAQIIAWFFDNYTDSKDQNSVKPFSSVFYGIEADAQKKGQALIKAKEMYDRMIQNKEAFAIGSHIKLLKENNERLDVEFAFTTTTKERKNEISAETSKNLGEITKFERKRLGVVADLTLLQDALQMGGGGFNDSIDNLSLDLGKASASITGTLDLGGGSKDIRDWIISDDLKGALEGLKTKGKLAAITKPPASMALEQIMKVRFGPRVADLTDGQKKIFYSQMQQTLTSSSKSSAYNDSVPKYPDPNKNWNAFKQIFTGTNPTVRALTSPIWFPARGTVRTVTGLYKGFSPAAWPDLKGVEKISSLPGRAFVNTFLFLWKDVSK